METSIFIAQIVAIAYLSIAIGILFNAKYYRKMMDSMIKNPGSMYLGGIMALIAGYIIITYHNVWVKDWTVIITVLGWMALVKGIILLAFPKVMVDFSLKITKKKNFTAIGIFALIVGIVLGYYGFLA